MTYDIEQSDRTTYMGDWKVRSFEMDITNYDDDTGGDGEAFAPSDAGMHRFLQVIPTVVGTGDASNDFQGSVAQYDEAAGAVRLYVSGGTDGNALSELGSDGDNGAVVRVTAIGK